MIVNILPFVERIMRFINSLHRLVEWLDQITSKASARYGLKNESIAVNHFVISLSCLAKSVLEKGL
jgi:hypothetical protein